MHYATFVRGLVEYQPQEAQLYRLHPSYAGNEYMVVVQRDGITTGFSSDEYGLILNDRAVFWIHGTYPEGAIKQIGYAL